jgi:hypothetical protein
VVYSFTFSSEPQVHKKSDYCVCKQLHLDISLRIDPSMKGYSNTEVINEQAKCFWRTMLQITTSNINTEN